MRQSLMMFCAGALMMAWAVPASAQDPKVAKGAALFESNKCTICHAAQGKGTAKRTLDGAGSKLDAATVKLWITDPKAAEAKTGKKAMPPMKSFASLPAEDIEALVAFVMSLK
jgi:mono/diheme cytochrome c family protein